MTIKELSDRYPFQLGFVVTIIVVATFALVGSSVSGSSAVAEPTPAYTPESAETETEQEVETEEPTPDGPRTTFGDGTFLVNKDIQPGTYRTDGGESCYYARRSDTSGTTDGVITNDNPKGQVVVTIESSDVAFRSQYCGTWRKI